MNRSGLSEADLWVFFCFLRLPRLFQFVLQRVCVLFCFLPGVSKSLLPCHYSSLRTWVPHFLSTPVPQIQAGLTGISRLQSQHSGPLPSARAQLRASRGGREVAGGLRGRLLGAHPTPGHPTPSPRHTVSAAEQLRTAAGSCLQKAAGLPPSWNHWVCLTAHLQQP